MDVVAEQHSVADRDNVTGDAIVGGVDPLSSGQLGWDRAKYFTSQLVEQVHPITQLFGVRIQTVTNNFVGAFFKL